MNKLTRRDFVKRTAIAGVGLAVPWKFAVTSAHAAQSPQVPLPGSPIPQFIDPVPNLLDADHLIVDGGTTIELEMREHLANILPAAAVPGYAGSIEL